jgi:trehalose 2-sulfotransferase
MAARLVMQCTMAMKAPLTGVVAPPFMKGGIGCKPSIAKRAGATSEMKPNFTESALAITSHDAESPGPIRNFMDPRLDFPKSAPLRKSYIIASSYRCGSTFFCAELLKTGVLGVPGEYLNIGAGRLLRDLMMRRLQADSPEAYFAKLLACRTSKNGIFGMKVHFPHFEAAMSWCPSMLTVLSPVTYIYLNRRDQLAQAVSMAKAMQTDTWSSMDDNAQTRLIYDEALIARSLRDLQQQKLGWMRWFQANNIAPIIAHYEDLAADSRRVIRTIVELLGAANDEPEMISLPVLEKQADDINFEWRERFELGAPDWESWFPSPDLESLDHLATGTPL